MILRSNVFRIPAVITILFATLQHGIAQQLPVSDNGSIGSYTCGSDWISHLDYPSLVEQTRQLNPALYQQMVSTAEQKGEDLPRLLSQNDLVLQNWYMIDRTQGSFYQINTKLVYYDDYITVWLDVADTATVKQSDIDAIAEGLVKKVKEGPNTRNANRGLIFNDIDIFGEPPVNRGTYANYLSAFVLTDIREPENLSGGVILGYFNPYDQTTGYGSNRQNVLYIDDNEGLRQGPEAILGTMAHEFQHLINHRQYEGSWQDQSTHWIYNEGLSEVASLRNGYKDRDPVEYIRTHSNYSYFDQPDNSATSSDILRAYDRSMLWIHYLSERFGDTYLKQLVKKGGSGVTPARLAMQALSLGTDVESVFMDYWVANYLRDKEDYFSGDSKFLYQYSLTNTAVPIGTSAIRLPTTLQSKEASIKGYDAYLYAYYNTGGLINKGLRVAFDAPATGREFGLQAVISRIGEDNQAYIEIQRLVPGQSYTFESFSQIVFIMVNLSGSDNAVNWTADPLSLSSVDDRRGSSSILGITQVAPHPLRGNGRLELNTPRGATVFLDLYNDRGELVDRIINGEMMGEGTHSVDLQTDRLPTGAYTLRLRDDQGNMAVRRIIVQ